MVKSKKRIKRLFFDIETSPNLVESWNIGYDITIGHDDIVKERAIICLCYKWEGEDKVHTLKWDAGDDSKLVNDFLDVILEADEVVGHNGDNFDLKWFRTRAIIHGIQEMPEFKSIDTLKIAKDKFKFNNNKLDYIAFVLGLGRKIPTERGLWRRVMAGNKQAMTEMCTYCANDVVLLEKVYNKLKGYTKPKTHVGVLIGESKCSCPTCGGTEYHARGNRTSGTGTVTKTLHCQNCGQYYSVALSIYEKENEA